MLQNGNGLGNGHHIAGFIIRIKNDLGGTLFQLKLYLGNLFFKRVHFVAIIGSFPSYVFGKYRSQCFGGKFLVRNIQWMSLFDYSLIIFLILGQCKAFWSP